MPGQSLMVKQTSIFEQWHRVLGSDEARWDTTAQLRNLANTERKRRQRLRQQLPLSESDFRHARRKEGS